MTVKCGRCVGCRLERSYEAAIRCYHEASLYDNNCFITLTYDGNNLPPNMSLMYSHYQGFMKRLRERCGRGIRFYMCGEYGGERGRPHFHAILFNFDFKDKYPWAVRNGSQYSRSSMLDGMPSGSVDRTLSRNALWPYGNSEIGDFSFNVAAYVARYIMKKQLGNNSSDAYDLLDSETGEVFEREREMCHCSTHPGLGYDWFMKYWRTDVFPQDFVLIDGQPRKVPRYYEKLLKRVDPFMYDEVKASRLNTSDKALDNNTPERLYVREQCAEARVSSRKRSLD